MSDLAATNCGCGCDDGGLGGARNGMDCSCIILVLLLLSCCGNNNGFFGGNEGCGFGGDNSCLLLLVLLLCCGNGRGFC